MKLFLPLLLLAAALPLRGAQAGGFYWEAGGGIAQLRGSDAFLPLATPAAGSLNIALNLGIFRTFPISDLASEFHLGVDLRYDSGTGSGGANDFTVMTPYLVARLQLSIFYVEGGYGPFVWRRIEPSAGFGELDHVPSAFAYLAEAGVLWPITPKFSLGAALDLQWINQSGMNSPSPIIEAVGLMRFYFGFSSSQSSQGRQNSSEWKGWRYPFGHEMN